MTQVNRWNIAVLAGAVAVLLLVGLLDWWIGHSVRRDISVLPLYLGPICAVVWLVRGRAWIVVTLLAACVWLMAQVLDESQKDRNGTWVLVWNGVGRLVTFGAIGALTAKVRSLQRRAEASASEVRADPMGLLSREGLAEAMADPGRLGDCRTPPAAVLMIDVERPLTGTRGGRMDNMLLLSALVASTMRQCARPEDLCARMNDEQFAVLMPRTRRADAERLTAELIGSLTRVRESLNQPFVLTTLLCVSETLSVDTPELLRHAEISLAGFKASSPGKHTLTVLERSGTGRG
jgi:GGDEF domain-containing protein